KTPNKVDVKDISIYAGSEYEGYVVDRHLRSDLKGGEITIRMVLRDTRFPSIGDKFSSRIAQKSTVAIIMNDEDMPFTDNGMRPDIIISPIAFTSRMTGSYILEMLFGKAALLMNRRILGGAFDKELDVDYFMSV